MTDFQNEQPQQTSSDRRSLSTKKWVERRNEAKRVTEEDDKRVTDVQVRAEQLAREGYHNPMGVWIGLAVVAVLVVAGWLVIDTLRCDPLESDLALVKKDSCR
jgi:cobalamin biosynthesis Mg chelatase CobN